jgi:CheY-like chemotaxis protein
MSTIASPHVLALNDFPAVLAFFRDLLEEEGYRVSTQTIAAPDLTAIGQLAPDMIVLDAMWLTPPEWDLLQRLAAEPRTHAIPVVLCTIPVLRTSTLQARLDGLTVQVVNKPYTLDDLLLTVVASLADGTPVA